MNAGCEMCRWLVRAGKTEEGTTTRRDDAAVNAAREGPQRQAPAAQRTRGRAPDPCSWTQKLASRGATP